MLTLLLGLNSTVIDPNDVFSEEGFNQPTWQAGGYRHSATTAVCVRALRSQDDPASAINRTRAAPPNSMSAWPFSSVCVCAHKNTLKHTEEGFMGSVSSDLSPT